MRKIIVIAVAAFIALMIMFSAFGSFYTVDQGERAVVLRNGSLVRVDEPGLHWKTPWIDTWYAMEVRTQKLVMDKMSTYSKDNQSAEIRASVNYHLDPAHVADVYATLGRQYESRLIQPLMFKYVKDIFGQFGAGDVVINRDRLAATIQNALATNLLDNGIIVDGVQIENIDFDDAYEAAIRNAMQAEAEVRKQRQVFEQNKVVAESVKVNADAAAYKTRTEADAAAYMKQADATATAFQIEARGRADSTVIKIRGDAEASAIQARGDALRKNPDLVALTAAEKWNGTLPQSMVPSGALPFLGVK